MEKNRCAGCKYYRPEYSASQKGPRMCHYLLDNKRMRERNGDECLSYEPKRKKRVPGKAKKAEKKSKKNKEVVDETKNNKD